MNTIKSIDQLDQPTADYIFKWLIPQIVKDEKAFWDSKRILTAVRTYLRGHKLTPVEALEKIKKENGSAPGFKWIWK